MGATRRTSPGGKVSERRAGGDEVVGELLRCQSPNWIEPEAKYWLAVTSNWQKPEGVADVWLDMDTYGLSSAAEQLRAMGAVTPNDLQRVATRLFRDAGIASVVVGNSELVKTSVERYGKVEILGAVGSK